MIPLRMEEGNRESVGGVRIPRVGEAGVPRGSRGAGVRLLVGHWIGSRVGERSPK